jgi:Zn-dependent protease/CBS domain-containing protein
MFTARWRLFRVFGIPLYVDASWLIILALLTWTLSTQFRTVLPEISPAAAFGLGLIAAVLFFICIVLHELGHALVGRAEGMNIRGITLFLFGGVAELESEPRSAGAEFLMAIAGPVVSAVLAALFWLGTLAATAPELHALLIDVMLINLFVLIFNLVPAFPLDGGRVFRSALWAVTGRLRRATYWASLLGQGFAWLLIALGVLSLFSRDVGNGIWLILIGVFLNNAARASYRSVVVRQLLEAEPVRRFMNPQPITVSPVLDLRTFVDEYVYRHHRKAFPVVNEGRLEGIMTTREVAAIPRADWDRHTVGEVMRHDVQSICIAPDADAMRALAQMQRTGFSRLLITEEDQLRGIVSLKDLLRFLNLKMELHEDEDETPRSEGPWRLPARREENVPH